MTTQVPQTGWRFDIRQTKQGPLDHESEEGCYFAGVTLWVSFSIGQDVELQMTTYWRDGESSLDVKARAYRRWSEKFRSMADALEVQGEFYAQLAANEVAGR
nr:hypothetical protein [Brevundimonas diminuta]